MFRYPNCCYSLRHPINPRNLPTPIGRRSESHLRAGRPQMAVFFAKRSSVPASDDDEIDPLAVPTPSTSRMNSLVEPDRSSFQSLMLPRARFLPVTGPPPRRATLYGTRTAEASYFRHRSLLLDRTRMPAPAWEKWCKSEGELKKIKNMKVREFYANQVPLQSGDYGQGRIA